MPSGLWTDYAASSFAGGSGTSTDPYQIKTATQLSRIAAQSWNNKYFKLMADIDLTDHYWAPINSAPIFIDGNNKKISNLYLSQDSDSLGFIGRSFNSSYSSTPGKVDNIIFTDPIVYLDFSFAQSSNVGIVLGSGYINCNNISLINPTLRFDTPGKYFSSITCYAGFIAGSLRNGGTINNCDIYKAKITDAISSENVRKYYIGGILGEAYLNANKEVICNSNIDIEKINLGQDTDAINFGGIVGAMSGTSSSNRITIDNCTINIGTILISSSTSSYLGGIFGRAESNNSCKVNITHNFINGIGEISTIKYPYILSGSTQTDSIEGNYYNSSRCSLTNSYSSSQLSSYDSTPANTTKTFFDGTTNSNVYSATADATLSNIEPAPSFCYLLHKLNQNLSSDELGWSFLKLNNITVPIVPNDALQNRLGKRITKMITCVIDSIDVYPATYPMKVCFSNSGYTLVPPQCHAVSDTGTLV